MQMKTVLYWLVYRIADVHSWILRWNDRLEPKFTDKQLHFWVIGILGMAVYLLARWLFARLARKNRIGIIAWLFTFTLLLGLTLAIEIGQFITNTGTMDLADMVSGAAGFWVLHGIWMAVCWLRKRVL